MSVKLASTDGVEIELHEFGGHGPHLLICHATGFCAGPYRPLAARLLEHFRVSALDFRGHGHSTNPSTGDFAWSGMIDDVLTVIDHLGGPVFGFGHSMGGAALLGAERRRPETIRSAYVFEPIIIPDEFEDDSPGADPLASSARRRRPTFGSRAEALTRFAGRPPLGVFRADALWHYVEEGFADDDDGTVSLRCAPEVEAAVFEAGSKPLTSHMADIGAPVTLAVGGRDPSPGPADFGRLAASRLAEGELRTFDHLGHFAPFQDPDLIADDIVRTFSSSSG